MAFKINVCAKQVPDTNALKIKDKYPDTHITVITMGPPQANDLLFECIAMGADEGILVSDRAVGGSDTWATSNTLEAAVRKVGDFDLLWAGRQAIDGDTAQVGPQLAEKLGLPQVTYVEDFEIDDDLKNITVKRQLEDGYEVIKLQTPCMLTAIKELNEPRYMSMSGIFGEKKMTTWNAKDIEVDLNTVGLEASPTNVFRSFTPAPKGKGVILEGDTEKEIADELLVNLKEKQVI